MGGNLASGGKDLMAADGQARSRRKPIVTRVPVGAPGGAREPAGQPAKPSPAGLGIDLATLAISTRLDICICLTGSKT